jgi:PleD family two-component response regulator
VKIRENPGSEEFCFLFSVPSLTKTTTEDLNYMIKQADDLLYKAKSKGRNQCLAAALES